MPGRRPWISCASIRLMAEFSLAEMTAVPDHSIRRSVVDGIARVERIEPEVSIDRDTALRHKGIDLWRRRAPHVVVSEAPVRSVPDQRSDLWIVDRVIQDAGKEAIGVKETNIGVLIPVLEVILHFHHHVVEVVDKV